MAYSNAAKTELLGVPGDVLAAHGAVSEEAVRAMAEGARSAVRRGSRRRRQRHRRARRRHGGQARRHGAFRVGRAGRRHGGAAHLRRQPRGRAPADAWRSRSSGSSTSSGTMSDAPDAQRNDPIGTACSSRCGPTTRCARRSSRATRDAVRSSGGRPIAKERLHVTVAFLGRAHGRGARRRARSVPPIRGRRRSSSRSTRSACGPSRGSCGSRRVAPPEALGELEGAALGRARDSAAFAARSASTGRT